MPQVHIRSFLNKATTEIFVPCICNIPFGQLQQSPVRCPGQRLNKTTKNPKLSSKTCLKIEEAEPHHPHSRRTVTGSPCMERVQLQAYSASHGQRCPVENLRSPLHLRYWSLHTNLHDPSDLPHRNSYKVKFTKNQ